MRETSLKHIQLNGSGSGSVLSNSWKTLCETNTVKKNARECFVRNKYARTKCITNTEQQMHWNDQIIVFQSRPMHALLHPDYCFTIRTQWTFTYIVYKRRQKWHLFKKFTFATICRLMMRERACARARYLRKQINSWNCREFFF